MAEPTVAQESGAGGSDEQETAEYMSQYTTETGEATGAQAS